MATGHSTSRLAELCDIFGEITAEDCKLLIEEFGGPDDTGAEIAQLVYEKLETSQIQTIPELIWNIKQNPCFCNSRPNGSKKWNGDSWSLARSRSANAASKHINGPPVANQPRPASTTAQMENPSSQGQPMPFSGTSNPIQIQRSPKGTDPSSLRLYLSKYLQDTTIRNIFYDIYEKRNPRLMILMRGASGSGKSTLANVLFAISEKGEICSADQYFVSRKGEYKFNRASLGDAHETCRNKCRAALVRGDTPIIIDNTNTRVDEMMPYVQMAVEQNYDIKLVEPNTEWKRKAGRLAQKTVHGVPKQTIEAQLDRFEKTTTNAMIEKVLKIQGRDRSSYCPNQDLDWGVLDTTASSIGTWSTPAKPVQPSPFPLLNMPLSPKKVKVPLSPLKSVQPSWTEPLNPASSPALVSDFVPDLKGANGNCQKQKKGKKNGSSSGSNSSSSPESKTVKSVFFEDPAHAAFEKLKRLFPSVAKEQLEEVFNNNDGNLDACAGTLLERGISMSGEIDDITTTPLQEMVLPALIDNKSEGANWDVTNDGAGSTDNELETRLGNDIRSFNDLLFTPYDEICYSEPMDHTEDAFEMVLPVEFARVLLGAFGHPEDEGRSLNPDELKLKIGANIAFEIYKSLYVNMHNTEMGTASSSSSEGSTRSSSPTVSTTGSMEDEFENLAISLSQMDLETSSGDPQLATIISLESKLHRQNRETLRNYSAPYRTMAQNVNFCMLKQEYPYLDAAIVDEVYSQCMLNVEKTKMALNEMYPNISSTQKIDTHSSTNADTWTLKYNPKDVQVFSQEELRSMQKIYEDLERDWTAKMVKFRDYHEKCKSGSNSQIKAHYITEAKKLSEEMKNLADEIQYYKAVNINSKHKNDQILDLHGLKVNGAMRVLKEFLQFKEQEFLTAGTPKMIILIITGQGKHSKNGAPVLQPAVRNFLAQKNYKFHSAKPGSYTVILTRGSIPTKRDR